MTRMNRRELMLTLPALAVASRMFTQTSKPAIPVKALNYFSLAVADVKRSVDFYQGLFGMPVQARQGSTVLLRMGSGPQFLTIEPAGANPPRIIPRVGMTVENFNAERVISILEQHGVTRAAAGDPGLSGGAMKVRVTPRAGTSELFFGDPDGIVIQVQDTTYCGGTGPLGNTCSNVEAAPAKGLLAVKDLSHFTIGVSNATRSQTFYQELFAMPVRSRQGTTPGLGVGPGVMFVMFIGGAGGRGAGGPRGGAGAAGAAPPAPAPVAPNGNINHVCMNMDNFNPDAILKTLADYGITARGEVAGAVGPLKSYVTLRMANRGGAPEGTPELYFTDPDGLLIQLQDVKYCGGAGFLGDVCEG